MVGGCAHVPACQLNKPVPALSNPPFCSGGSSDPFFSLGLFCRGGFTPPFLASNPITAPKARQKLAQCVSKRWVSKSANEPSAGGATLGLDRGFQCNPISLLLFPNPLAHSKHMPIWMPQMHLPHIPRHVRRRKSHFKSSSNTFPVNFIHVVHPHRHPRALVGCFVVIHLKGSRIRSLAAPALRAVAKKN